MILPIATLLYLSFGTPLPEAIVEAPRARVADVVYDLSNPSPRARAERAETIEQHRDFVQHRHNVALEASVAGAWDNPPVPMMPAGPSTGAQPIVVNVWTATPSYMPMPRGSSGIPARAGMLPDAYWMTYARMVNLMFPE